jgi:hypothetical protein
VIDYEESGENIIDPLAWILVSLGLGDCDELLESANESEKCASDWVWEVFDTWKEAHSPQISYDFHSDHAGGGYSISYWKSGDLIFSEDEVGIQQAYKSIRDLISKLPVPSGTTVESGNFHQLSIPGQDAIEVKSALKEIFAIDPTDPEYGTEQKCRSEVLAFHLLVDDVPWRLGVSGEWACLSKRRDN